MALLRTPIVFPPLLQRKLEDAAKGFLEPANSNYPVDFLRPTGEAALVALDSVSWLVFKNPIALFVGGITAVILELAEPRVREGVWKHTNFKSDPLLRLKRTGLAAMVTVYGARSHAEAMIAGVRKIHDRIGGITPTGQPYHADDPELLNWVHATATFGFLQAYNTYVRPLSVQERNSFYAEGQVSANLFGALSAPTSEQEVTDLFNEMHNKLEASPIIFDFLNIMRHAPILPLPGHLRVIQEVLVMSAIELVPQQIRERLALTRPWTASSWQISTTRCAARAADKVLLRSLPAAQACLRMGLPEDYLYR